MNRQSKEMISIVTFGTFGIAGIMHPCIGKFSVYIGLSVNLRKYFCEGTVYQLASSMFGVEREAMD